MVLDVILIPRFGATGAAIAMVVSWAIMATANDWVNRRSVALRTPAPTMRVIVATVTMATVLMFLPDVLGVAAVLIGGLAYLVVLFATGAVTRRDVARFRSLLRPTESHNDKSNSIGKVPRVGSFPRLGS